jgi:hypothetical protein
MRCTWSYTDRMRLGGTVRAGGAIATIRQKWAGMLTEVGPKSLLLVRTKYEAQDFLLT